MDLTVTQSSAPVSLQIHRRIAGRFGREMLPSGRDRRSFVNTATPVENLGTTGMFLPCSSRASWTEKLVRRLGCIRDMPSHTEPTTFNGEQRSTNRHSPDPTTPTKA